MQNTESLSNFSENIGLFYESALCPDNWPYALEALCEEFGANKAQMLYMHPEELTFSFACGFGFDPYAHGINAGKLRRYLLKDPVALYGLDHPHEVFSDRRVINPETLHASPMQTDIRDPADMEYLLTVYMTEEGLDGTVLILFRGRDGKPFTQEDEKHFNHYLCHLKRATLIHKNMASTQQFTGLQAAILNRFSTGVLVLDQDRRVILSNEKADAIIDKSNNLTVTHQRLICMKIHDQKRLNQSINAALDTDKSPDIFRRIAIRIMDDMGTNSILAVTTPLHIQKFEEKRTTLPIRKAHFSTKMPNRRYILLTLCDSAINNDGWCAMLQQLFELTPAEAALANKLADDCSLKEASELLGRTIGTARIQLQSIFEKTDTNRQSSLIRLLMSIPI